MIKFYTLKKFFIAGIVMAAVILLITGCSDPNTILSDDFDEGAFLAAHSSTSSVSSASAGK